jgi:hypothetical protein
VTYSEIKPRDIKHRKSEVPTAYKYITKKHSTAFKESVCPNILTYTSSETFSLNSFTRYDSIKTNQNTVFWS